MSDISPELLPYVIAGIFAMASATLGYYYMKAKPELNRLTQYVTEITLDIQIAAEVIKRIKSLVTTCRNAAQDKTITPEEADKIMKEIEELANSEPVKKLFGE